MKNGHVICYELEVNNFLGLPVGILLLQLCKDCPMIPTDYLYKSKFVSYYEC